MNHSGVSGYKMLRRIDPRLCNSIVDFSERLVERHNLEPDVACDLKQALCQFAIDLATRGATAQILKAS